MVENYLIEQAKGLIPRKIEAALIRSLFTREIIILLGSRQVGKTSLMLRLINYLLNQKKVSPQQIVYLDLEFPQILSEVDNLYGEEFLAFLSAHGVDTKKKTFVFIDEVHYLSNPSSYLKTLHDHYPELKLIVSGSSTLQIRHKFKDALTGRKRIFEIAPLDFEEFLYFSKSSLAERKKTFSLKTILDNMSLPDLRELRFLIKEFSLKYLEYTTFGGYPRVALYKDSFEKIAMLSEIYRSYIRKDIKDFAEIESVSAFNNLIELLAHQIGSLLNISELTNSLNISRPTVENYLFLLQNTFIVSLLPPFYTNRRQEIVKSSKVFFYDSGLRNSIVRNFDHLPKRIDGGALFENNVFLDLYKQLSLLESLHFWRSKSKAEVDFIVRGKDIIPVEVKYQTFREPKIPSGLRSFINIYKPKAAFVITPEFFGEKKLQNTRIFFIPAWCI
jgi:hypothetical protein